MIVSKDGKRKISEEEFDEMFDRGEDISDFVDFNNGRVVEPDPDRTIKITLTKKVNVDLPIEMVNALDDVADGAGVTRQGLIKMWLWERLRDEQERNVRLGIASVSVKESE